MRPRVHRGFAMVTAIFILVVLAMLGAFVASISSQNQVGAALDVQGAKAYQAARAGIEWGLYQALVAGSCVGAASNVTLTGATSLAGMTVTVTCQTNATPNVTEAGLTGLYTVTAWACNAPSGTPATCPGNAASLGYVERKLSVLAEK